MFCHLYILYVRDTKEVVDAVKIILGFLKFYLKKNPEEVMYKLVNFSLNPFSLPRDFFAFFFFVCSEGCIFVADRNQIKSNPKSMCSN